MQASMCFTAVQAAQSTFKTCRLKHAKNLSITPEVLFSGRERIYRDLIQFYPLSSPTPSLPLLTQYAPTLTLKASLPWEFISIFYCQEEKQEALTSAQPNQIYSLRINLCVCLKVLPL